MTHHDFLDLYRAVSAGTTPCAGELRRLGSYTPRHPPHHHTEVYCCAECDRWVELDTVRQVATHAYPPPGERHRPRNSA